MARPFLEAFRGPTGSYDTNRILFFMGGVALVAFPPIFQWMAFYDSQAWDPLAFIGAWGGGLGSYLSLGGLGIAVKDKGVASAQHTSTPQPPEGGQP